MAWFRPAASGHHVALDDTRPLVTALSQRYRIDLVDEAGAHEFVWRQARDPYDFCVYELADTWAHTFVWPYLFHYPGLLRLRSDTLGESRELALDRIQRTSDFMHEVDFSGWELVRAPILASRLVVVSDDFFAARLRREYPEATVRCVPPGLGGQEQVPRPGTTPVRFGFALPARADMAARAVDRARAAGAAAVLVTADDPEQVIRQSDVVLALDWPPPATEPPATAIAAMALGRAVVVLETGGTARWPALDPQTWQSRSLAGGGAPIVVSIDPRDEEHSLVLAIRRLASDPALVERLGAAGHAWWRDHATLEHAARGWDEALAEALARPAAAPPAGWPRHLTADATDHARALLRELRVEVDFLK